MATLKSIHELALSTDQFCALHKMLTYLVDNLRYDPIKDRWFDSQQCVIGMIPETKKTIDTIFLTTSVMYQDLLEMKR